MKALKLNFEISVPKAYEVALHVILAQKTESVFLMMQLIKLPLCLKKQPVLWLQVLSIMRLQMQLL